jgi:hypothetical protein
MDRKFSFLAERTEDGLIRHDRDEVRELLLDLEGAVTQLGGIVTMSAIREEIAPDEYVTTGVLVIYDSFAPARARAEVEPEPSEAP